MGERNKSEAEAGRKRGWTELGWRERERVPPPREWPWHRCMQTDPQGGMDRMWSRLPVARELLPMDN